MIKETEHFIKTYGFDEFIRVYKNEAEPKIYCGFEKEAVEEYLKKTW